MKKYSILYAAAILPVLAISCAKEMPGTVHVDDNLVSFVAGFDNGTRTALEQNKVIWTKGDAISIFDGNVNVKSVTADSTSTARFDAELSQQGPWFALYPYSADAFISGTAITTVLPGEQTAVHNTFADDLNIAVARSDQGTLTFKNVLAYLKFSVANDNIISVKLTGNGGEALAGEIEIDYNDGVPTWESTDGLGEITLTAPKDSLSRTFLKGKSYYIGVLPQTFASGFMLEFTDAAGDKYTASHNAGVSLSRSVIYDMGTPDSSINFDKIIVFEDAVVKADLIKNLKIDTNGDGEISKSECAAVTYDQLLAVSCPVDTDKKTASAAPLWTDATKITKFRELKYFTGVLSNIAVNGIYDYRMPPLFAGCTNLVKVEFPDNLSNLANYSFFKCEKLDTIKLGRNMRSVFAYTFSGCKGLKHVEMPRSLVSLSTYAFEGCTSLVTVLVSPELASISTQCFSKCNKLSTISYISAEPGRGIELPALVTNYNEYCFRECSSITSITLPEGVTTLGYRCFAGMGGLKNVVIPSTVTSMSKGTFETTNTSKAQYKVNLESLTLLPVNPPKMDTKSVDAAKVPVFQAIYVPAGSVDKYKSDSYWKAFADVISAIQ